MTPGDENYFFKYLEKHSIFLKLPQKIQFKVFLKVKKDIVFLKNPVSSRVQKTSQGFSSTVL